MFKKAFTLIEILAVISVLGILIALAIPRFAGMQQNANLTKAQGEIQTITTAVESYYSFNPNKVYPPTTVSLQSTYLINASPQVLTKVIYDPFGATATTEYNYLGSANGKYYVIWSVGVTGINQPTSVSNNGTVGYGY